jgi:NAD(P)-dependent dehydrogenase (short-subunit alcohol dehydrogenase family)
VPATTRLIVVTGGGGGIGRAAALLCARRGDWLAILDKNGESAKEAAEMARAEGAGGALGLDFVILAESSISV